MNQENSSSSTRKSKFTPKVPKRRQPATTPSQQTSGGAVEDADPELLLKCLQEKLQGRGKTTKKESSVRVAFGPGATTPTTSFPTGIVIRERNNLESDRSNLDHEQIIPSYPAVKSDETGSLGVTIKDVLNESSSEDEIYEEPWDYEGIYYPSTLPLRMPYSGNPDMLDAAEFGEAARKAEYNKKNVNAAAELGLLDESERENLLFFQLPRYLPSLKESGSSDTKGKEPNGRTARASQSWEDFPEAGHMGKLLVYNSGAIKLKLGETLYDVYPGSSGESCEHVMAMNFETKDGCLLGQVEKHAVVGVDADSILDGLSDE